MLAEIEEAPQVVDPTVASWPRSQQELIVVRTQLAGTFSLSSVLAQFSTQITHCGLSSWTHKAKCIFHAGGNERTPSLFFSDKTGTFKCFSCGEHGDVFDILSRLEGSPWWVVVERLLLDEPLLLNGVDINSEPDVDLSFEINLELSTKLRTWLKGREKLKTHSDDALWAERTFAKIDERLASAQTATRQELIGFKVQIEMDMLRRQ